MIPGSRREQNLSRSCRLPDVETVWFPTHIDALTGRRYYTLYITRTVPMKVSRLQESFVESFADSITMGLRHGHIALQRVKHGRRCIAQTGLSSVLHTAGRLPPPERLESSTRRNLCSDVMKQADESYMERDEPLVRTQMGTRRSSASPAPGTGRKASPHAVFARYV